MISDMFPGRNSPHESLHHLHGHYIPSIELGFLSLTSVPAYPFLGSLLVAQDTTTNCVSAFTFFFFFSF